jgi:hypothetical protein
VEKVHGIIVPQPADLATVIKVIKLKDGNQGSNLTSQSSMN